MGSDDAYAEKMKADNNGIAYLNVLKILYLVCGFMACPGLAVGVALLTTKLLSVPDREGASGYFALAAAILLYVVFLLLYTAAFFLFKRNRQFLIISTSFYIFMIPVSLYIFTH